MTTQPNIIEKALERLVSGKDIHVKFDSLCEGLDWQLAGTRPEGAPHSIFQVVTHMAYWQDWVVRWLDGKKPPIPKHASASWPENAEPSNEKEWKQAVKDFRAGLGELKERSVSADPLSLQEGKSRLEMLQVIAAHNSHHAGQVVLLRQILGSWPPPSGGLTW